MLSTALISAHGWEGPGPWWPLFPLLWFAFLVFVVLMVGRFGRRRWERGSYAGESRLAERFAAGEIDDAEYRNRLTVLRGSAK
jgi:putative membrane protein